MIHQSAISIQRLAQRLDVSVRTARRIIRAGELRAHRIGRQWRVFETDIEDYLKKTTHRSCPHRGGNRSCCDAGGGR